MRTRHGFTLIEVSIVLVIIGLIIGGILLGRTLIEQAELRAQVSQVQKMQAATLAFRTKYNALPGDMAAATATQLGFNTRAGTLGWGDGDGYIRRPSGAAEDYFCGELYLYLMDLDLSGLFKGNPMRGVDGSGNCQASSSVPLDNMLQPTKISGGLIYVLSSESWTLPIIRPRVNYISLIGPPESVNGSGNPNWLTTPPLFTPAQAHGIDSKMDDGLPLAGTIFATQRTNRTAATTCITGSAYNLALGTDECDLFIKGGF